MIADAIASSTGVRTIHCRGNPRFRDTILADVSRAHGAAAAWEQGYAQYGTGIASRVDGDFVVALCGDSGQTFLAVDRFSICTICYSVVGGVLRFSERADDLAGQAPKLNPGAVFDYLYFHDIPSPRTIFEGICRLPAGHFAAFADGRMSIEPYWRPRFVEDRHERIEDLCGEFKAILRTAVRAQLDGRRVGCFLSGGTDSSTVAGILTEVTGEPARTFSIGFDVPGYDEMEYARIAARHFKTDHQEYYVTPDDLLRSIPDVASWYDQPFGNSSVLPAYYCAKVARAADVELLLAGDGGDELFGGNTRYAKQSVFGAYERVPRALRRVVLEPALLGWQWPARIAGLRKVVSYVEQARVPMPDRLQMYNLIMRLGLGEVLTPALLAAIDADDPMRQQREFYAKCEAKSLVNRMLAYDWKYTLAESDLPKVVGATSLAGVAVGFPLLDDRLVDFSLRLEPEFKLKGLKLRWFFKEALRGFLPPAIIVKKKHGFGLPFGLWLTQHKGLRALADDSLATLAGRGLVRAEFLDRLMKELLPRAPGYYGEMVWILMMLEQWLHSHANGFTWNRGERTEFVNAIMSTKSVATP